MEKRECKLCFKTFANGRALGGHMRSHMKKLPLPSKLEESRSPSPTLLSFEADSPSSSSSSEDEGDDSLSYGLRDNPKRSIHIVDPEFSFVVDPSGSVIQDRESETETESSKKPTRKRSKRAWKVGSFEDDDDDDSGGDHYCHKKIRQERVEKLRSNELCKAEPWIAEAEPASSISDTTTEEDVAHCLMMLSRDKWKGRNDLKDQFDVVEEDEDKDEGDEEDHDGDESEGAFKSLKSRTRGKYTCETCKKVFRSYQALGGHRASHKKIKVEHENNNNGSTSSSSVFHQKIHECPICFRVFPSGQALGGHKRTHLTGSSTFLPIRASTKLVGNFIDLNLPAPADEDDISQIDNSGVSDVEFVVDRIRQ